MTPEYLAGFFDGEGSIGVYSSKTYSGYYYLRVQLVQKDGALARTLLNECVALYGGGISYLNSPSRPSPGINWQLNGKKAANLLAVLLPFLVLKREQAIIAIAYQAQKRGHRQNGAIVSEQLKAMKRPVVGVVKG